VNTLILKKNGRLTNEIIKRVLRIETLINP